MIKKAHLSYLFALLMSMMICVPVSSYAKKNNLPANLPAKIKTILDDHLKQHQKDEYFSGIALSIYLPKNNPAGNIQNYYTGHVSHDENSEKISDQTLFHIGSISKSFTSALLLRLQEQGKLKLSEPLGSYVSEYPTWSSIRIHQLLDMTSGLPNYSDTPVWNAEEYKNIQRVWSTQELIEFVYPKNNLVPPLRKGYFYTNTGYLLAELVAQKIEKKSTKVLFEEHLFKNAGLHNTFYPIPQADADVQKRLAHGYNYNPYDNPFLVGQDVSTNNLTWAAGAGGIISNSEDVIKWIKALFIDEAILSTATKKQLTTLTSLQSGNSITRTSKNDPQAFGLGVIQGFDAASGGRYWFYEGVTLGYRALYFYKPCSKIIISAVFNSTPHGTNDASSKLLVNVYREILKTHPQYRCED